MKRPPLLPILPLSLASLFLLSGCVGAPLKVGDEKIEKPLEAVTGRTTTDVKKAASKNSLNLWDVYALAVEHTESLASKYENVEQADAQSRQARASLLPQISLNGSKGWQSSSYVGTSSFTTFSNVPSTSLYLTGSETLLTGLNQVAALQGAEAQRAQSRHLLRQEARNLLLEVARSFYTVLQAEDALQSKGEIQNLTEKILTQEKRWRAIGRSRESDVLATEAQLSQVKGDLENAKNQLVQARESLALLGGVKAEQSLKSQESAQAPSYSLKEASSKVEGRFDVLAAKDTADLADALLLQAHGGHLPSLAMQGSYYLDKEGGSPSPEWNLQLVASLPVFDGGNVLAQEEAAASRKRQADLQYSLTRRQALEDIRESYQSLSGSLRQLSAYGMALEAAKKEYAAVARDRKLALNTNLDLLQSLVLLQNAQNNYRQARYQALFNRIWLGVATGELPKTGDK